MNNSQLAISIHKGYVLFYSADGYAECKFMLSFVCMGSHATWFKGELCDMVYMDLPRKSPQLLHIHNTFDHETYEKP